jgi:penicillin-binding protein 1A
MSSMLADVINAGTAYKARQSGFTLPAAGKTGTTDDYKDAWFIGYTPHLVTGVWVGFDQPKTIAANGYAADLAVPIWGAFMKTATKADKPDWFERPDNVIAVDVCRVLGTLPNTGCAGVLSVNDDGSIETKSMIYTDYFVKGTQPTTICPLHPANTVISGDAAAAPALPSVGTAGIEVPAVFRGTMQPPEQPTDKGDKDKAEKGDKDKKKRGFWGRIFGRGGG